HKSQTAAVPSTHWHPARPATRLTMSPNAGSRAAILSARSALALALEDPAVCETTISSDLSPTRPQCAVESKWGDGIEGSASEPTHATGHIDVASYDPKTYEEVDAGPNLVEVHVTETFSGDIEGTGVVRFLQAMRKDGSATFVGIERVTGTIAGRTGAFLLQDA